jgi:glycosyltransferase involved in cell wall biosynthesis
MLTRLKVKGAQVVVVTSKTQGFKGGGKLRTYDQIDGMPIYRLYRTYYEMLVFPKRHIRKIIRLTESFQPDLIFCGQELTMPVAIILQKYFKVPIVLLVENAGRVYSGEVYSKKQNILLDMVGIPSRHKFWYWLCRHSDTIITCHPHDQQIIKRISCSGINIRYLPWPTSIPTNFQVPASRNRTRGIYVGSLYPFKNTQEFQLAIPRILEATPAKEFVIVGPGPHAAIIKKLQKTFSGLKYIPELPRSQALRLIASSYFAYTPVVKGGWGFIGDCWSMRTPIVMTHNDSYVQDGNNSLLANNVDDLVRNINRLYEEPDLYEKLQANGYQSSAEREASVVGDTLYDIFSDTIASAPKNTFLHH